MVLGLMSSKHTRGTSVKLGYIVHVKEIRPWPPSASLRSVQTVWIQWEYGNKLSGSFISAAQDSIIVFNESFKLPVILYRDKKAHDKFQKNYLEFSLFMPRKDKAKGQLLGTATINFADYGVIENTLSITAPLNFKKGSNNSVQSSLLISLESDEKDSSSNSSPNVGLPSKPSLDNDNDHFEIASFTDDDASSHSSRTGQLSTSEAAAASTFQIEETEYGNTVYDPEQVWDIQPSSSNVSVDKGNRISDNGSSLKFYERSITSVKNPESPGIKSSVSLHMSSHKSDNVSFPKFYGRSMTSAKKYTETPVIRSSVSSVSFQDTNGQLDTNVAGFMQENVSFNFHETIICNEHKTGQKTQQSLKEEVEGFVSEVRSANNYMKNASTTLRSQEKDLQPQDGEMNDTLAGLVNSVDKMEIKDWALDDKIMKVVDHCPKRKSIGKLSGDCPKRKSIGKLSGDPTGEWTMMSDKAPIVAQHAKSIHMHGWVEGNGLRSDIHVAGKTPDPYISDSSQGKGKLGDIIERTGAGPCECDSELETKIKMLKAELREAAATEVGLYSVVAEHGSSGNKVHAPARRLSRFYSNACKVGSQVERASAARAAVSGLVVVSKSCGSDVPRLSFWLSNAIMLRSIVSQTAAELPHSNEHQSTIKGTGPELNGIPSDKCLEFSHLEAGKSKFGKESADWEDVSSFIVALEKVESWLFSRIVESLWWQSFTPHMQPMVAKGNGLTSGQGTNKNFGRNSSSNQEQRNFSMELWKKAFKDACERLCPNRGAGHECGCLSALVRLVMEQLVNRLDVAMFNAILRESADEMPTDPLSDPISESKVLPIPAGKSSFGAGVELKNAIGSWSRWLTDLFDLEDEPTECGDIPGDGRRQKSFKAFRLLHALSDLMMLPYGALANASSRKEVCPMFGPAIIKRVLASYVPDEFSPDPIPQNIIDALDIEEASDDSGDVLTGLPCTASPTKYSPPPAALLTCVGEVGKQVLQSSRLSTLKKSYNSDDELDQLDSPFMSIVPNSFQSSALTKLGLMPKEKSGKNVVRYQLLREMWKDDDY